MYSFQLGAFLSHRDLINVLQFCAVPATCCNVKCLQLLQTPVATGRAVTPPASAHGPILQEARAQVPAHRFPPTV